MHLHEGQNTRRERWSLTLRFPFLSAIGSQLVVFNPMGILITYPQADLALVTVRWQRGGQLINLLGSACWGKQAIASTKARFTRFCLPFSFEPECH